MTEKQPLTASEMARIGNAKRWGGTTLDQRRQATQKAREASLRAAAARRKAREEAEGHGDE